jgi:hypothetical protein
MTRLSIEDLWSLEEYAKRRPQFRPEAIARKNLRRILLGAHVTLQFEDELTVRYQVQEMLRIERTFEQEGIQAELDAYNPLIPDGSNLKATMMIEYPDEAERKIALANLVGIENCVWMRCGVSEVTARSTEFKTSAVHFLRFECPLGFSNALRAGEPLIAGVSHARYAETTSVPNHVAEALSVDFA